MSFFTALVTSKIAAGVLAGGTLAAGGTAAAAYTGAALPGSLEQGAHNTIGSPATDRSSKAAHHKPSSGTDGTGSRPADAPAPQPRAIPAGPDAAGPAAFGLCTAFTSGGLEASSTAYKSLAAAANGSADVATYCKSVVVPGRSGEGRPEATGNPRDSRAPHKATPPAAGDRGQSGKPSMPGKS